MKSNHHNHLPGNIHYVTLKKALPNAKGDKLSSLLPIIFDNETLVGSVLRFFAVSLLRF